MIARADVREKGLQPERLAEKLRSLIHAAFFEGRGRGPRSVLRVIRRRV
jgi:hypothetical protein